MTDSGVRIKSFARQNFTVLLAVLVIVALAGGWMTYNAYAAPGASDETQTDADWSSYGEFNHSATVTNSTAAHPDGATLTDQTVYPLKAAPQFQGTYTYAYHADSGSLDGNVTLVTVTRSVEDRTEGQTTIWETSEVVREISVSSLEPGETVKVPFEMNMNETATQADQINEDLGNPPGDDEVRLVATVALTGEVNGQPIETTENHALRASLERPLYRVEAVAGGEDYDGSESRTAAATTSPVQQFGGPLLLLLALCGIGGLLSARRMGRLQVSDAEEAWLAFHDDRKDFDEWITTIRLPEEAFERPRAEATSLASLVNLAIDTENSVIEDPDDEAYYVIHDEYLYVYTPPALNTPSQSTAGSTDDTEDDAAADSAATVTDGGTD